MSKTLVFLGAHNGERFIEAQLESILRQQMPVDIIVSDDGSTDQTIAIVKRLQPQSHSFRVVDGPRQGFASNFLSAFKVEGLNQYEWLAWSDQDDIWHPDHLEFARKRLSDFSGPAFFCCRTRWIDEDGNFVRLSPRLGKQIRFENAMCQSLAGGNTFVFNRAAISWLKNTFLQGTLPNGLSHDWIIYQLFCGAGFDVVFSTEPRVDYRQHSANILGENRSLGARLRRCSMILGGSFRSQVDAHLVVLEGLSDLFLPETREMIHDLIRVRRQSWFSRLIRLRALGLRRESRLETMILSLCFVIGLY